jgi:hypothetical protein
MVRFSSLESQSLTDGDPQDVSPSLQEWLEELYFDSDRPSEFTKKEIKEIGELIRNLMRLEPSERISAKEASHRWANIFP